MLALSANENILRPVNCPIFKQDTMSCKFIWLFGWIFKAILIDLYNYAHIFYKGVLNRVHLVFILCFLKWQFNSSQLKRHFNRLSGLRQRYPWVRPHLSGLCHPLRRPPRVRCPPCRSPTSTACRRRRPRTRTCSTFIAESRRSWWAAHPIAKTRHECCRTFLP